MLIVKNPSSLYKAKAAVEPFDLTLIKQTRTALLSHPNPDSFDTQYCIVKAAIVDMI